MGVVFWEDENCNLGKHQSNIIIRLLSNLSVTMFSPLTLSTIGIHELNDENNFRKAEITFPFIENFFRRDWDEHESRIFLINGK